MDYFGVSADDDTLVPPAYNGVKDDAVAQPILPLLLDIRQSDSKLGMDIGGTLAKLVIALPEEADSGAESPPHQTRARALSATAARRIRCLPEKIGESGQCPPDLVIGAVLAGKPWRLQFMKGSTQMVAAMLRASKKHTAAAMATAATKENGANGSSSGCGSRTSSPPSSSSSSSSSSSATTGEPDGRPSFLRGPPRQVVASGGGAYNFKNLFLSSMGIELVALKEFQSLVDGLRFLHHQRPPNELYCVVKKHLSAPTPSSAPPPSSLDTGLGPPPPREPPAPPTPSAAAAAEEAAAGATSSGHGGLAWVEEPLPEWPSPLYPFLLVSFGSGVSILQVNSAAESDFERVGGTATGGATFLGLMHLLASPEREQPMTFDEAVALAACGDASKVDKLVGDIYGVAGCANLGMPASMTAANFGKLASAARHGMSKSSSSSPTSPYLRTQYSRPQQQQQQQQQPQQTETQNDPQGAEQEKGQHRESDAKKAERAPGGAEAITHAEAPTSQTSSVGTGSSSGNSSGSSTHRRRDGSGRELYEYSEADVAAATLQMIAQASAVLVRTIAQQAKCLRRVFVVGGFMDANPLARKVFAQNLLALNGRAIFVRHSAFLGALGALRHCVNELEDGQGGGNGGGGLYDVDELGCGSSGGGLRPNGGGGGGGGGSSSSVLARRRHLDPLCYGWDLGVKQPPPPLTSTLTRATIQRERDQETRQPIAEAEASPSPSRSTSASSPPPPSSPPLPAAAAAAAGTADPVGVAFPEPPASLSPLTAETLHSPSLSDGLSTVNLSSPGSELSPSPLTASSRPSSWPPSPPTLASSPVGKAASRSDASAARAGGTLVRTVTCPSHQQQQQQQQQPASTTNAQPSSPPPPPSFSPPPVCAANMWWQYGMLWAYAASFRGAQHQLTSAAAALLLGPEAAGPWMSSSALPASAPPPPPHPTPSPFPPRSLTVHPSYSSSTPSSSSSSSIPAVSLSPLGDWRFAEAIRCFERCLQLEPRCVMALWGLAWVHGHRSRPRPGNTGDENDDDDDNDDDDGGDDDKDEEACAASPLILCHPLSPAANPGAYHAASFSLKQPAKTRGNGPGGSGGAMGGKKIEEEEEERDETLSPTWPPPTPLSSTSAAAARAVPRPLPALQVPPPLPLPAPRKFNPLSFESAHFAGRRAVAVLRASNGGYPSADEPPPSSSPSSPSSSPSSSSSSSRGGGGSTSSFRDTTGGRGSSSGSSGQSGKGSGKASSNGDNFQPQPTSAAKPFSPPERHPPRSTSATALHLFPRADLSSAAPTPISAASSPKPAPPNQSPPPSSASVAAETADNTPLPPNPSLLTSAYTGEEAALVEATALRFALWPPSAYATHLDDAFCGALAEASGARFPRDPDLACVYVRSKLEALAKRLAAEAPLPPPPSLLGPGKRDGGGDDDNDEGGGDTVNDSDDIDENDDFDNAEDSGGDSFSEEDENGNGMPLLRHRVELVRTARQECELLLVLVQRCLSLRKKGRSSSSSSSSSQQQRRQQQRQLRRGGGRGDQHFHTVLLNTTQSDSCNINHAGLLLAKHSLGSVLSAFNRLLLRVDTADNADAAAILAALKSARQQKRRACAASEEEEEEEGGEEEEPSVETVSTVSSRVFEAAAVAEAEKAMSAASAALERQAPDSAAALLAPPQGWWRPSARESRVEQDSRRSGSGTNSGGEVDGVMCGHRERGERAESKVGRQGDGGCERGRVQAGTCIGQALYDGREEKEEEEEELFPSIVRTSRLGSYGVVDIPKL